LARDVSLLLWLQAHVYGVAFGEELMEPEREEGQAALRALRAGSLLKELFDGLLALLWWPPGPGRQPGRLPGAGGRPPAHQPAPILCSQAERGLDPACQGVGRQLLVAPLPGGERRFDSPLELAGRGIRQLGGTTQALTDHLGRVDLGPEELGGDCGHGLAG